MIKRPTNALEVSLDCHLYVYVYVTVASKYRVNKSGWRFTSKPSKVRNQRDHRWTANRKCPSQGYQILYFYDFWTPDAYDHLSSRWTLTLKIVYVYPRIRNPPNILCTKVHVHAYFMDLENIKIEKNIIM